MHMHLTCMHVISLLEPAALRSIDMQTQADMTMLTKDQPGTDISLGRRLSQRRPVLTIKAEAEDAADPYQGLSEKEYRRVRRSVLCFICRCVAHVMHQISNSSAHWRMLSEMHRLSGPCIVTGTPAMTTPLTYILCRHDLSEPAVLQLNPRMHCCCRGTDH